MGTSCCAVRGIALVAILCAGAVAATGWHLTAARPPFSEGDRQFDGAGEVARGRLIFAAGDCASCHATPGQPDRLRLGGGMALASPVGTFRPLERGFGRLPGFCRLLSMHRYDI
jgi:hypothetical protein